MYQKLTPLNENKTPRRSAVVQVLGKLKDPIKNLASNLALQDLFESSATWKSLVTYV